MEYGVLAGALPVILAVVDHVVTFQSLKVGTPESGGKGGLDDRSNASVSDQHVQFFKPREVRQAKVAHKKAGEFIG